MIPLGFVWRSLSFVIAIIWTGALIFLLLSLLLVPGCAELQGDVWVEEYPIHDHVNVIGDGPIDSEVLVVKSRSGVRKSVLVSCGTVAKSEWLVDLGPGEESRGIVQLMAADVGSSTCHVKDNWKNGRSDQEKKVTW